MSDLGELGDLYQEVILDHSKSPRNFRVIAGADHQSEGYNPLCGDRLTVYIKLKDDVIEDISFKGDGCAISKASASMMTTSVKGKPLAEVIELFSNFHKMLTGGQDSPYDRNKIGKLTVFSGVKEFPVRVKCATLAWHTLNAGLEENQAVVSTEEEKV